MKILRKIDERFIPDEASLEEEKLCKEFLKNYKVTYSNVTEGLYGMEYRPVTIREFHTDYVDDKLTCIIKDNEVIGCLACNEYFWLNGQKYYSQTSDCGPQGPLIWDRVSLELLKR